MCGILGGLFRNKDRHQIETQLEQGIEALLHRGPDAKGCEIFSYPSDTHLVLAHTRLAILDLSAEGKQPMTSQNGRFVLIFNGEIYNYRELREELKALDYRFHTQTDTEVLLEAWSEWGRDILPKLIGMFSFVIFDKERETLTLVRDAFGIKPLFYTMAGNLFLFSSELPSLLAFKGGRRELNWQRSYDYLVHGHYDTNEKTFIEGVQHLLPAHTIEFDMKTHHLSEPSLWWNPSFQEDKSLTFEDAVSMVRSQFLENVRLHLRSDVPLGAALSGGIDSSAIVAAIRYLEPDYPIHTFSYVAANTPNSEAIWVDMVNKEINAIAHPLVLDEKDMLNDLDDLIRVQGEPFGSSSIFAQYRLFKKVREAGITVTLDGQGADELLAGYNGYPGQRLRSLIERGEIFRAFRFAGEWSKWPNRNYRNAWMHWGSFYLPENFHREMGRWVGKNAMPNWINGALLKEKGVRCSPERFMTSNEGKGRRVVETLSGALLGNGLQALLRHGDRNSMRFSIESRVPFLTLPMASLLLSLPEHFLISDKGETKHIFREAMKGIVPEAILTRRDKIGFSTPEEDWLRKASPMIRKVLLESGKNPFINTNKMVKTFDEAMQNKGAFGWQIWRFLNFTRWAEQLDIVY